MKRPLIKKAMLITNPHVWVLIFLVTGLALIYYYGKANFYYTSIPWFRSLVYYEYKYDLNGSLFIIPFFYATIVFWWRGTLAILLISEAVMLPYFHYMTANPESFFRNIIYPFITFMVIGFVFIEFKWREGQRKNSAEREAERQFYTLQVFKAQENERHRIAQELHDDTLQMLYLIADRTRDLKVEEIPPNINQIRADSDWIRKSILDVAEEVRRISLDLRPSILDELSLVPAIRWLIGRLSQDSGPDIQISVYGIERKIQSEADVMIFRIIEEALNNARKHAKATKISVTLEFALDICMITVQDNGIGFLLPKRLSDLVTKGKLGLIGMQQRAKFLGGAFDIKSEPGIGTTIFVKVKG